MLEKGSIVQESVSSWSSVFGQKLVLLSFANLKRSLKWVAFQFSCRCSRFFSRYKYIFDVGPQKRVLTNRNASGITRKDCFNLLFTMAFMNFYPCRLD